MLRKFLVIGFCFWAPVGAWALGLGDIRLSSALNEPLYAEIPMTVSSPDELANFNARVAGADTFLRYGLDRPAFLNSFTFSLVTGTDGQPLLRVRSSRPVSEPFVTFLVEAVWDRGRLLREYTVLLDPPVFNEKAVAAPVSVAQSVTAYPAETSGQIIRPSTPPAPQPAPREVYRPTAYTGESYGPVRRNENLWNISRSAMVDGVSVNQMMVAIYNANPDAFMGNINLLKEGATLQIPSADEVRGLARASANSVVVDHNANWRGGRAASPKVADSGASTSGTTTPRLKLVAPEDGAQGTGGNATTDAINETRDMLAKEQAANAELGEELNEARAELEETRRLLNLQNSELADLQRRLAEQGAEVTDVAVPETVTPLDTATTVPGTETATTTGAPAEIPSTGDTGTPDTTTVSTAPDPTAATPPEPAAAVPPPVSVATVPAEESPGIIEKVVGLFSNLWTWIGIGLLALLGTLFVVLRGRESGDAESWDSITIDEDDADIDLDASLDRIGEASTVIPSGVSADVEYFEDTGTFKPVDFDATEQTGETPSVPAASASYPFDDTMAGETGVKLDQADPIAESDFHMAYGLYDQAAELISKALEKEPGRTDLHMKLVEIYFVWGNKDEFRNKAATMQEILGDNHPGEWEKIMILGKQICPDEEMFAGDASAPITADGVDLRLEDTGAAIVDFTTAEPSVSDMGDDSIIDLDLADDFGDMSNDESPGLGGKDDNVIDLDLGDALFASDEAPTSAGDDNNVLDFSFDDATASNDNTATAPRPTVKDQIETALGDGDDTEEMDLDKLGVDLDFGDITSVSEGTSGEFAIVDAGQEGAASDEEDFDALFAGFEDPAASEDAPEPSLDFDIQELSDSDGDEHPTGFSETRDKLLDTSELKVEMEELLASELPGSADKDETARGLQSISEVVDEDTGSFSAEIRALSSDDLEIGEELAATGVVNDDVPIGSDDDTVLQQTLAVSPELPQGAPDTDFSGVFADAQSGDEDATVIQQTLHDDMENGPEIDADLGALLSGDTGESGMTSVMSAEDLAKMSDEESDSASGSEDTTTMASLSGADEEQADDAVTFHGVFDESATEQIAPTDDFSGAVFGESAESKTQEMQSMDLDVGESSDESGDGTTLRVATSNLALPENSELAINEVGTKLDLARAYLDMGDPDGARGILEEVIQEGNEGQQQDARNLLQGINS